MKRFKAEIVVDIENVSPSGHAVEEPVAEDVEMWLREAVAQQLFPWRGERVVEITVVEVEGGTSESDETTDKGGSEESVEWAGVDGVVAKCCAHWVVDEGG